MIAVHQIRRGIFKCFLKPLFQHIYILMTYKYAEIMASENI